MLSAASISRKAERWFRKHQRALPWRLTYDPYHVWVSEVMLQQTRMEVVLRYYDRFLRRFPTIAELARASSDEVAAAWSGLGYYRRARMLRDGAIAVRDRFGGALPRNIDALRTIPGIGRYTAGAIASIAFDRPAPIVDGNIARLMARLAGAVTSAAAWRAADDLVRAAASPQVCNQALMEIGALICKTRAPECSRCPLRRHCAAFASGQTDRLPQKRAGKAPRSLRIPLFIVADRRGRILMRRHSGRLMYGMLHLPHGNSSLLPGSPYTAGRERKPIGTFRHTITNRRITFTVFMANGRRPATDYLWIDPERLPELPHPSYVRKALQLAGIGKI